MGDKATARKTMAGVGVPIVPGSPGPVDDAEVALGFAREIGFPVIIKAAAGGGGKGMRVANDPDDFARAFQLARSEALSAFGSDEVYVEKYLATRPAGPPTESALEKMVRWSSRFPITTLPGHKDLVAYFNIDNGSGRVHGIFALQQYDWPACRDWATCIEAATSASRSFRRRAGSARPARERSGLHARNRHAGDVLPSVTWRGVSRSPAMAVPRARQTRLDLRRRPHRATPARFGPPHLRTNRTFANLLRSDRPN